MLKWTGRILGGLLGLVVVAGLIAYAMSDNSCGQTAAIAGTRIKAVVQCEYGPPEILKLEDVAKPAPDDDQVLVKVRAAAVNPAEWHLVRGKPYVVRAVMGLRKPREIRLGTDYAGVVETVGKNVTQFKPGDAVFGGRTGAFSEYIVARATGAVVPKPDNVSFEQAAGVHIAGLTALQGLRDKGQLRAGQKVLINGASGGVGTYAVQIAKALGAEVTGVTSARNIEMVQGIGADRVIDYTRENFTEGTTRYDLIYDCVGNHGLLDLRRVLKPGGRAVLIGGGGPDDDPWIGPLSQPIKGLFLSAVLDEQLSFFIAESSKADLAILADMMRAGKLTTVIDRTYPLSDTAAALGYLDTGRARGKVILTVGE
ncbi:MAG: NAD(P)-dependent alcohol dehydrogenase [Rhodospirillaceae bacterium]|nr:NAD(P)-dependent alcohol dehydrogenase [Rhodospirillaceae bacterium]